MHKRKFFYVAITILVFVATSLLGEEWAIIGARSLGMGGTGVASARGPAAYYWNPALYAADTHYDLAIPFGSGIAVEGDMIEKADYLAKRIGAIDLDALQTMFNDDPGGITDEGFRNAFEILLVDIPPLAGYGTGVSAFGSLGAQGQMGNFGVSFLEIAYGGAYPIINLTVAGGVALSDNEIQVALMAAGVSWGDHTGDLSPDAQAISLEFQQSVGTGDHAYGLGVEAASTFIWLAETTTNPKGDGVNFSNSTTQNIFYAIAEATFGNNDSPDIYDLMVDNLSGVGLGLIVTREVTATVSWNFMDDRLSLGTNIKGVIAETLKLNFIVSSLEGEDGQSIREQTTDFGFRGVSSRRLAFDTGMIYRLTDTMQLGLTIRNLNQPTFSFDGENGYTLYAQTRTGLLWKPFKSLSVACDLDLFPNISEVIDGLTVQFLAGGVEWAPVGWFALRGGMYKNIAMGESPVYTMGMGFKIWRFYLDIAGSLGFSDIAIESNELGIDKLYVPERFTFMFNLGLNLDF